MNLSDPQNTFYTDMALKKDGDYRLTRPVKISPWMSRALKARIQDAAAASGLSVHEFSRRALAAAADATEQQKAA